MFLVTLQLSFQFRLKSIVKNKTIIVNFIKGEQNPPTNGEVAKLKASIVSQEVIFSPKYQNGLGLQGLPPSGLQLKWYG